MILKIRKNCICCVLLVYLLQTIAAQTSVLISSESRSLVFNVATKTLTLKSKQIYSSYLVVKSTISASSSIQHATKTSITSPFSPRQPKLEKWLKFMVRGRMRNGTTSPTDRFKDIFGMMLPYVDTKSYNSTTGDFVSYLYFNATPINNLMDEDVILKNINKYNFFENLVIKEQCFTATCGDMRNRCTETEKSVLCSCHIGFAGERCSRQQVVDGTSYGIWSNWTSCQSCKQKRFRYCLPDPMHGGRCMIGPNPGFEVRLCFENCHRNDTDEDRELVGYMCLGLILIIFILLFAFCYTYKFVVEPKGKNNSSRSKASNLHPSLEAYRVPSVLVNSSALSQYSSKRKRKQKGEQAPVSYEYDIPLKTIAHEAQVRASTIHEERTQREGVDNLGFHQEHDDNEDLYRQQLEIFLNKAPGLSKNLTTEDMDCYNESTKKGYDNNSDDNEKDAVDKSFSPAVKKQDDVKKKIIKGRPDDHLNLVMT